MAEEKRKKSLCWECPLNISKRQSDYGSDFLKAQGAILRNHCRNRSVSLKYSVDTPQRQDFFFSFLQPFIKSPLLLREKEIIVSIIAYISYIFKYQTRF